MTSIRFFLSLLSLSASLLFVSFSASGCSGGSGTTSGDLLGSSSSSSEPTGDLSGKWTGRWTSQTTVSGSFDVTMRQNGSGLDGDLHFSGSPCFSGGRFAGTMNGRNFSGSVTAGSIRIDMSGTLTGNTYDGTYSSVSAGACTGDSGTFTATR